MDVAAWLRELALERYEPAFRQNEIDAEVLPRLTAEDLVALGVTAVGHRRKLLDAIAALRDRSAPAPPAADGAVPITSEGERRQVTVLFADLAGYTELSRLLDPDMPCSAPSSSSLTGSSGITAARPTSTSATA